MKKVILKRVLSLALLAAIAASVCTAAMAESTAETADAQSMSQSEAVQQEAQNEDEDLAESEAVSEAAEEQQPEKADSQTPSEPETAASEDGEVSPQPEEADSQAASSQECEENKTAEANAETVQSKAQEAAEPQVGEFTLNEQVQAAAQADAASEETAVQGTEPLNNTMRNAKTLAIAQFASGNLPQQNSLRWYKFTIDQAGYVDIDFQLVHGNSTEDRWKVTLMDPNRNECRWNYYNGSNSEKTYATVTGLSAGTYYVKVSADDNAYSNKQFKLKVNYTQADNWESEPNDSKESADRIKLNTVYYGNFKPRSDEDWYKFTTPKDGRVSITSSCDSDGVQTGAVR